jgi:hypothetical protein
MAREELRQYVIDRMHEGGEAAVDDIVDRLEGRTASFPGTVRGSLATSRPWRPCTCRGGLRDRACPMTPTSPRQ